MRGSQRRGCVSGATPCVCLVHPLTIFPFRVSVSHWKVTILRRGFFSETVFFSSRRRHTRYIGDWSSDVCSSDLRFWYLKPEQIMEIILQTSARMCIFGLDFPYNLEKETKIGIETICSLPITEAEKELKIGRASCRERV